MWESTELAEGRDADDAVHAVGLGQNTLYRTSAVTLKDTSFYPRVTLRPSITYLASVLASRQVTGAQNYRCYTIRQESGAQIWLEAFLAILLGYVVQLYFHQFVAGFFHIFNNCNALIKAYLKKKKIHLTWSIELPNTVLPNPIAITFLPIDSVLVSRQAGRT